MLSANALPGVRLPAASESEVSAGVFTNKKLPEPQWERPILCRADEGPIERIQWLWPNRIPLGKVTLLTGPAGVGKSLVALDLATRVSQGADFPMTEGDQPPSDPLNDPSIARSFARGSVLVIPPMHEVEDVVRPRLHDMGADMSKVLILSGQYSVAEERLLALPDDLRSVEHALEKMDFPRLVIIDALEDICPDKRREDNTLRVLELLAKDYKVAIVVVASSNPRKNKLGRYMPPTDKAQRQAPVVWSLIPDDYDESRGHFITTRCNCGKRAKGFTYQIADGGRIEWGDLDEHQILPDLPEAENWLVEVLSGKTVGTLELLKLGAPLGMTKGMIHAGCQKLGYQKVKLGFQGGWYWKKPEPAKPKEPEQIDPEVLKETAWLDMPVKRSSPPHQVPPGPSPWEEADRLAAAGLNGEAANGQPVVPGPAQPEPPSAEPVDGVAPAGESNGAVEESTVPAVNPELAEPGSAEGDVCAPRDSLAPLENPPENGHHEDSKARRTENSEPPMTPMDADEGRTDEEKEGEEH